VSYIGKIITDTPDLVFAEPPVPAEKGFQNICQGMCQTDDHPAFAECLTKCLEIIRKAVSSDVSDTSDILQLEPSLTDEVWGGHSLSV
jgi:hypothetical protein